jgi:glutamate synthase domain-containing protein 2
MGVWMWIVVALVVLLAVVAVHDVFQTRHAILRNFPIIGHLRFILEAFGPELRQYIVAGNDEERPFSRDQRRWVYATSKKENSYFGFGTDNSFDDDGYLFFRHSAFPAAGLGEGPIPCAKVLGGWREREHSFRPSSLINTSAMSFGALSGPAVEAMNRGAALTGSLQNTGEGGISEHHRHGGELIFQIGTGYFGARGADGAFSLDALVASAASAKVRAIEVKLSQGAKPGLGGVLPAAKVTKDIAKARGVPVGITVASPAYHSEFDDVAGLVEFVESIAEATGLPVGMKSAVGDRDFWDDLAQHMAATRRGPDFISVDGGEGGTGAAPLLFSDHVALPFRSGFPVVFGAFARAGLHHDVVFMGAGKLGFGADAALALAAGVDMISVGREAMMAIGCIQAQRCHTGHCPTGVATQGKWLQRGLDPTDKAVRLANYLDGLSDDLRHLSAAMGVDHPSEISLAEIDVRDLSRGLIDAATYLGLDPSWYRSSRP